ncbi:hypothetical protein [Streptomyces roseolilacinus]|uniref:Uncharacterized protein n=1 Tax=Streptomyces roseolilacinus TaxID=66904 RepID=A0A918AWE3_9ACTN|nr:hypothetical protein [Streptomyces roseolilacinus]GGP92732.1 hypothetical protein GCM10010249_08540 [Streptomyces roseolilacinus]
MTRTKKYAAVAAAAAVLVSVPTGAYAATERSTTAAGATTTAVTATTAPATAPQKQSQASGIRVVEAGERVDAGRGYALWLTPDGKHWSDPDGFENFRSVVDGNIDRSRPGVSHQSEGGPAGVFHSGVYYGTKKAARVELVAADGTRTPASLVELPGRPGWGAWYVHTPPSTHPGGPGVALYDRAGRLLAELPAWDF